MRRHGPFAPDFMFWVYRAATVEGIRRAALLTAELRARGVSVDAVPGMLASDAAKNPFTLAPFEWDSSQRAVVYEGPEKHRTRRHVYFH